MINANEQGGWIIPAGAVVEEKHIPSFSVVADEEVLARIWNGGYSGYFRNKSATDGYWKKVKKTNEAE